MRASTNSIVRSSMHEDEQDLSVIQEKNASEGFNFTVSVGLKKQPKKGLTVCLFKTKVITNAVKMRPLNTELEDFKFKILIGVNKEPFVVYENAPLYK